MKAKRTGIILAAAAIVVVAAAVWYVAGSAQLGFARRLANGINLGNSLDATKLWEYSPDAPELSYETGWGNPPIAREQFEAIYDAGFQSVRIPVTWEDHMDEWGSISPVWMGRVEEVVSMAIDTGLYVILDTHHETWLDLDTAREAEITARYQAVWRQIAERFADYDNHLLFEGMNEPRLRGSEQEWTAGTPGMRDMVNRLNAAFVDTVRAVGGENEQRYLLISPYASNHVREALEALAVPRGNVIVSVHMYVPYEFCQNEEGTAAWEAQSSEDTAQLQAIYADLKRLFIDKGVPVIITEFGCKDKGNLQERMEWATYVTALSAEYGIPCLWWENGSTYRLLERETGRWLYQELVDCIAHSSKAP